LELEEGPETWPEGDEVQDEIVTSIQTEWEDPWGEPFTAADAFKPRPPVEYLVAGLFRRPSLNMLFGPPGGMKTLLTLDLCIAVAAGMDWLPPSPDYEGGLPFTTTPTPTMFIDFDNGVDDLHEKIESLIRGRDLDPENLSFYYYSFPESGFVASNKAHIGDLMLRIQRLGIGMVWIDNLGIVKGGANENADEMIPIMNNFRYIAEKSRVVVGLVHHQNKTQGFKRRSGESIRGHSSIEASLNLALLVDREEYSDAITVKPAKVRGSMAHPFAATFAYEHQAGTSDLETAIFFGSPQKTELDEVLIDAAIKAALKEGPLNQTALKNAAKEQLSDVGINRIRGRIERMVAANKLIVSNGPRGSKVYQNG
jgi:hypothetical protein